MSELFYLGVDPATASDLENFASVDDHLDTGVSRDYAQTRIDAAVALKASKVYVDTQDELYSDSVYHVTQNGLLVPTTARGAANGVAALGSDSKVPAGQVPFLGSGVFKGPWGPTVQNTVATGATPAKVAEWPAMIYGINGVPMAFMNISTTATSDRTVIEIRIGTAAQTTYAAQTLISRGFGRNAYTDWQTITVMPCDPDLSEHQDGVQDSYDANTSWLVTAWMYNTGTGSSATSTGQISTAPLFWARTGQ